MISGKQQKKILELQDQGLSTYEIAKIAGVEWHTAKKYSEKFQKRMREVAESLEKSILAKNDSILERITTRIFGSDHGREKRGPEKE